MPKLPFIDYSVSASLFGPFVLLNDQSSPLTIFTIDSTAVQSCVLYYSIIRGSTVETGRIFIASNMSDLSFEVDKTNDVDTGILLTGAMSGTTIQIQYISNNTGQTATFKYSQQNLN